MVDTQVINRDELVTPMSRMIKSLTERHAELIAHVAGGGCKTFEDYRADCARIEENLRFMDEMNILHREQTKAWNDDFT